MGGRPLTTQWSVGPDGGEHGHDTARPSSAEGRGPLTTPWNAPPQANAALAAWCGAGTALSGSHPPHAARAGPRDPPTGPQYGTCPEFLR